MRSKGIDKLEKNLLDNYFSPFVMGLVLLLPPVGLTNSGKTLITGSDIYENQADGIDYGLSIIDITTLGASRLLTLPKTAATGVKWTKRGATAGTVVKTTKIEIDKKNEKK